MITSEQAAAIGNAALIDIGHPPVLIIVNQWGTPGINSAEPWTRTTYKAAVLAVLARRGPSWPARCFVCVTHGSLVDPTPNCHTVGEILAGAECPS